MTSKASLEQIGTIVEWGDYCPNHTTTDLPHDPLALSKLNTESSPDGIKTCWLNQFSALKIYGPDAERFLQGQLTCDLSQITTENVQYGACCSAKGRTVANFTISFDGENYWLILPSNNALVLEKHLQKYKVFFKASIENCQDSHLILGQWANGGKGSAHHALPPKNEDSNEEINEEINSEIHQLQISKHRRLVIVKSDNIPKNVILLPTDNTIVNADLRPTLEWNIADIYDGLYYVTEDQSEVWIPQHINWHQINGISFKKGCYTGQEIVARLQYLGKAKKALFHYRATFNAELNAEFLSQQASLTNQLLADQLLKDQPQPLFNSDGKNMGQILLSRSFNSNSFISDSLNNDLDQVSNIEMLAVLNTDTPDEIMYLNDSKGFPVNLFSINYDID